MRIQKVIAAMGLYSRRDAENLIAAGKIQVNNKTAKLGDKISGSEVLVINGKRINYHMPSENSARIILLNKPTGWICSHRQITDHPTVYQFLPNLKKGKWMSVGRLDLNSHGLLLLTNNGDLLQKLMHPKQAMKRVYIVRVRGDISKSTIDRLVTGIKIDGVKCKFSSLEKIKSGNSNSTWRVVLHEGKNREIRKMFAEVDCQVNNLKRIAFGPFTLPHDLPSGRWFEVPFDVVMAKL